MLLGVGEVQPVLEYNKLPHLHIAISGQGRMVEKMLNCENENNVFTYMYIHTYVSTTMQFATVHKYNKRTYHLLI